MTEMFIDYLRLKVLKTKWDAKEIEFGEFANEVYIFSKKFKLDRDMIIYSLGILPK